MNKELEDYMMKKMFYDKYGEETMDKAEKIYFKQINFEHIPRLKKIWIWFSLGISDSRSSIEVKKIQEALIYEISVEDAKGGGDGQ